MTKPLSFLLREKFGHDPFIILISCLLSLRAKDTMTYPICLELFSIARTPQEIIQLSIQQLEELIHSIGFYHKKARILHDVCQDLLDRFDGKVPDNRSDLMSIRGVGIKTANLVLGEGFGIPAICVDIHVHRISNRLGLVHTATPEETEKALMAILPKKYWIEWNQLIVMWGQNICTPISPKCSQCPIYSLCDRVGVTSRR